MAFAIGDDYFDGRDSREREREFLAAASTIAEITCR